jgi:hypothetical protein
MIEYEDMAAYGARTAFENGNAEWGALFEARADSPEKLLSVELLVEYAPSERDFQASGFIDRGCVLRS